jgi:hypothetical protein
MYHCSQIQSHQHILRKVEDADKHRDKRQMATFECGGWLHITVDPMTSDAMVKVRHEDDHVPYYGKDVPVKLKDYVAQNPRLRASQVRRTSGDSVTVDRILILFVIRSGIEFWNFRNIKTAPVYRSLG